MSHEVQGLLTMREREVASLLTQGFSNKEIANHLGISPYTVRDIISSIFLKLKVRNRVLAAAAFATIATQDK